MSETVTFTTDDGVRITGAFHDAATVRGAAVLLHMMPATKESWSAFATRLASLGIASLAIDLRGHGDSTEGPDGHLEYKLFDDAKHQESRLDVEAALVWLHARLPEAKRFIAGASIGANLAILAAANHREIAAVLALSPGLDYHGVMLDDALAKFTPTQKIMLAASREDIYAYATLQELAARVDAAQVKKVELADAGHGTALFERVPAFMEEAAAWFAAAL